MSEIKYTLPGPDTVTIAGNTIDKLVRAGDGDAALLYLYILRTRGKSISAEATAALHKNQGWIASAMAVLSRLGLVKLADNGIAQGEGSTEPHLRPDPPHSVKDMKRELEAGSVFFSLVEEAQRRLGKIMAPDELLRLFGIYDSLHMEPEVILLLITHCIAESRTRSGGRAPSMRYIEKAAYTWEREGVMSLEQAEEYLKALESRRSTRGEIKRVLQIRDREFAEAESRYVDKWITMGFEAGAVGIAYDRTLLQTGKLAWSYMDGIMSNWHGKGLLRESDILEKERKPGTSGTHNSNRPHGNKFGAADQDEITRMTKLLNKIKDD